MGFNTVAVILNDQIHEVRKSGRFGERIYEAVSRYWATPRNSLDRYFGAGKIISMAHADYPQVVVVQSNTGWSLHDDDIPPEALEAVARQLREHGYRVTKLKAKEPAA